ncbi:uncharacterized protein [Montipora capricornis]|uniref:uncharacterized protein isoform X2 n=1 Tax=Montipora capricornis TaxID=246305 RepID=UPI0035F164B0
MKPAFDIWKFVLPLLIALVKAANRKNPRSDQIERVLNETHSILWNCRHAECNPGNGLNVQCGTSVPFSKSIGCVPCTPNITYSDTHDYSTCKICRKCKEHQKKTGYCSVEEDTTKCLETCEKGHYWENNTCHTCSDCCGKNISLYHEKQCENSALPRSRQCRKTICENPSNPGHQDTLQKERGRNGFSQLTLYTGICTPLAIVIAICSVLGCMTRKFGWKETKVKVKNLFRSICCLSLSEYFSSNSATCDQFQGRTANTFTWNKSEVDVEEATDNIGSLNSVSCSGKRPGFQRLLSAPPEVHSEDKASGALKLKRSVSHPGCLARNKVEKEQQREIDPVPLKSHRKVKRIGIKKYVSVPEGQEVTESLDPAKVTGDRNPKRLNPPSFLTDQCTSTTGLHCSSSDNIESVPTDFKIKLLSGKLSQIPIEPFRRKICNKLNQRREFSWDDYRLLGDKIGLDKDAISALDRETNPTDSLMNIFDSKVGSSVEKFQKIVEGMGRDDVVTVINEWIVHEWHILCKSSSTA